MFNELKRETFVNNDRGFKKLCDMSIKLLNKHAPIKMKYKRGNHMPFITKDLSKAIMKRSQLRNNYSKNKTDSNRMLYKKQRNNCVSLLRKSKTNYYANLDAKKVSDNKLFWQVIKPSLSDKSCTKEQMNLVEKGEILKTDLETAEVLYTFFGNIVKNLEINQYSNFDPVINHAKDPTLRAILKFKDHPSILAIQNNCKNGRKFAFEEIDLASIEKEIHNLKMNEASQSSDIPTKIIKENVNILAEFLWKSINISIKSSTFPSCLKLADATPLHKKGKKDKNDNYRPVSILPTLSKCFEKCMFSQMSAYFDEIFSKYQYGFRKGYSSQQCLLALLEKWKAAIDKGKVFGALLTDLSKAFDCLNHELLVAKLNAYEFTLPALKLVHDYLSSDRKQRTRVNNSYSTWFEILFGVPQGSILRPLLFNIFLADLSFILSETDIANYADDNAPYTSSNDISGLVKNLKEASKNCLNGLMTT